MEEAEIICHAIPDPACEGCTITRFEWRGDRRKPAKVFIGPADRIERLEDLPWPLKVIERDHAIDLAVVVRLDSGLSCHYYWCRAAMRRLKQWLSVRLILTAQVWGFAYVPYGEIPSRKHLFRKRGTGI